MRIRDATLTDVPEMSTLLQGLTALGKRTSPDDEVYVRANYIEDRHKVCCSVAKDDDGMVLGFQSLKVAHEGNVWGVTPGWGIIGTHICPNAARQGIGRALFAVTRTAAKAAGLGDVDATIAATNADGLAYYEAMGFRTYRTPKGRVCKRLKLTT